MNQHTINDIFNNKLPLDNTIMLSGWIRTRRDSKAGFSFFHLSDGSCMQPIQVVASNSLSNYEKEILHVTTGCSICDAMAPYLMLVLV